MQIAITTLLLYPKGYNINSKLLQIYVKLMLNVHNLTQLEHSEKSGVGLCFIHDFE